MLALLEGGATNFLPEEKNRVERMSLSTSPVNDSNLAFPLVFTGLLSGTSTRRPVEESPTDARIHLDALPARKGEDVVDRFSRAALV